MNIEKVFDAFGDELTIRLFKHITGQGSKPTTTRKQYYSRMERLMEIGLIERVAPKQYAITNFGHVIKYIINTTERALDIKGRLSALDALQLANRRQQIEDMTQEHWQELIQSIIKDEMIKDIIFKAHID
jgi:chemotaxis regulatin CheY-phosphate phosphatase CheZ